MRTDDDRISKAVGLAQWQALQKDIAGARLLISMAALVLGTLIALGSETSRDAGVVYGRVIAMNLAESKWPNPPSGVTVKLDDGRTVVVLTRGGVVNSRDTRVCLHEMKRSGFWKRSTFELCK